jgi:hypothetical protein
MIAPFTTTTPLQRKGRRGPKARGVSGRRVVTQHIALSGSEVHSILGSPTPFRRVSYRGNGYLVVGRIEAFGGT